MAKKKHTLSKQITPTWNAYVQMVCARRESVIIAVCQLTCAFFLFLIVDNLFKSPGPRRAVRSRRPSSAANEQQELAERRNRLLDDYVPQKPEKPDRSTFSTYLRNPISPKQEKRISDEWPDVLTDE